MNRRFRYLTLCAAAIAASSSLALAQEAPIVRTSTVESEPSSERIVADSSASNNIERIRPDEPVDLSLELILRGDDSSGSVFSREQLSPPAPVDSAALSGIEMKSVEQDLAIPLRPYPDPDEPPTANYPIWADASIGLHTTASLQAGLSGTSWPFDYNVTGEYQATEGFTAGADRTGAALSADAGYVIGDGYGIFSGGYMGAEFDWSSSAYGLYALPDGPNRIHHLLRAGLDGEAETRGIDLRGALQARRTTLLHIENQDVRLAEHSFEGSLTAERARSGLGWAGDAELRLTNNTLGSVSYGRLGGAAVLSAGMLTLRGGATVSMARGSDDRTEYGIAPVAEIRLQPLGGILVSGGVGGGLRPISIEGALQENPYLSSDAELLPVDEALGYHLGVRFEPISQLLSLSVSARRSDFDRYALFGEPIDGEFPLHYSAASVDRIEGSATLALGVTDAGLHVRYTDGYREDGVRLPWIPKWDVEAYATHRLPLSPISGTVTMRYLGGRPDAEGVNTLAETVLLGVEADYALLPILDLYLQGRNLLNADYELWSGYRERGIFLALGARLRL